MIDYCLKDNNRLQSRARDLQRGIISASEYIDYMATTISLNSHQVIEHWLWGSMSGRIASLRVSSVLYSHFRMRHVSYVFIHAGCYLEEDTACV